VVKVPHGSAPLLPNKRRTLSRYQDLSAEKEKSYTNPLPSHPPRSRGLCLVGLAYFSVCHAYVPVLSLDPIAAVLDESRRNMGESRHVMVESNRIGKNVGDLEKN
jgi:hypothetical protein